MSEEVRLSERAMLVSLNIGQWSGTTTDKEVTDEVIENKKAEKGAGKWSKQLIARKFLHHVNSKITAARATHKARTLPWEDKGPRILAAVAYMEYTEEMRLGRLGVEAAANETFTQDRLENEYKPEAKQRLGDTYREDDYGTAESLRSKYYLDVEVRPIPEAGDFRTKLSDKHVAHIMKDIEKRSKERLENAMTDVYQRIADATERMVDRLRNYVPAAAGEEIKGGFKDSIVWNIKELADLLPILNITGDQRLEDMRLRLLEDLTQNDPTVLRLDDRLRKRTADKAEKILAKARMYCS